MNKKGFTLVELLAVIVILVIILAIAVPGISNVIKGATKGAFESDAKMVLQQLRYEKVKNESFDVTTVTIDSIGDYKLSNDNYEELNIGLVEEEPYIVIIGKNKWAGLTVCGTIKNMTVIEGIDTESCEDVQSSSPVSAYNEAKGVNRPKLIDGMTPVIWDGIGWVETTANNDNWYNYTTTYKKWANARTADGSMWVWIPRYIYKISSGWHTNTTGTIDIKFSMGTDDTLGGTVTLDTGTTASASNNKWTNHPAFTFGDTELTGIWIAKFQATAAEGLANTEVGDNTTSKTIKVVPNTQAWRYLSVGNAFQVARGMETNSVYGWGTSGNGIDTHLTKGVEWGAVAYLSKSNYGKGTEEVWKNPADNYTTGCAGDSTIPSATVGCTYTYDTVNGNKASTTGTIYGIYDMNGCTWERVPKYINNGDAVLATYGAQIMAADAKYKEVYNVGTSDTQALNYAANTYKGDSVYEVGSTGETMTGWFGDYTNTPYTTNPWFTNGGRYTNTTGSGIFAFSYDDGAPDSIFGFRPVILIDSNL